MATGQFRAACAYGLSEHGTDPAFMLSTGIPTTRIRQPTTPRHALHNPSIVRATTGLAGRTPEQDRTIRSGWTQISWRTQQTL